MIPIGKEKPACNHPQEYVLTRTSQIGHDLHIEKSCQKCGQVLSVIDCKEWERFSDRIANATILQAKMDGEDLRIVPKQPYLDKF